MEVDPSYLDRDLLIEQVDEGVPATNDGTAATGDGSGLAPTGDGDVLEAHADRWYRPDSRIYGWAVRTADGGRRYFKTREGAADRLRAEYESDSSH